MTFIMDAIDAEIKKVKVDSWRIVVRAEEKQAKMEEVAKECN